MNPKYPLYIVSKGRAESRLTSRALEKMQVPYYIVIEQSDYKDYAAVIDKEKILILPEKYLDEYEVLDNLGRSKSTGPGAARNFVWEHSKGNGFKYHWVMDDNINRFCRYNNNEIHTAQTGSVFLAMEDFVERYENVAMAGPNYFMFIARKQKYPPFVKNTRIYSCNFIKNDVPFKWRGRYNEDTILSLDMLKAGYCTIQFNAMLQEKVTTQVLRGGNSEEFYDKEGTLPKSQMQVDIHPDVSRLTFRFGRIHHHVDYTPFKKTKLIKKQSYQVKDKINDYGMKLKYKNGTK
tara:strand:+ start:522 stop:1397 length:876 start_codon:yes stop_codon:yes gene_type:complete